MKNAKVHLGPTMKSQFVKLAKLVEEFIRIAVSRNSANVLV